MREGESREFRRGWAVLLTAAIGLAAGLSAVPYYTLSTFIAPLQAEFGWSRGEIGVAATILTVMQFLTGPVMGRFADRHGVRRLLLPSALLLALATLGLTQLGSSIAWFYAGYVLVAFAGSATTSVAYSRVVNTWFERSRGLALGITMAGSGLTAFAMPLVLARVIGEHGWRGGYVACAIAILAPWPLLWRYLRERVAYPQGGAPVVHGLTTAQVVRTRRFWTMVAAAACFSPAIQVAVIHLMPMLGEIGLTAADAARAASMLGVGIVLGRFISGTLLDRLPGTLVGPLLFLVPVAGYSILYQQNAALAPYAVAIIGISIGVEGDLFAYFTARYFGMRSYAELFGWVFGVMCISGAAGPLLMLLLPESGGYRLPLLLSCAFAVVAAALLATLGRYPDWSGRGDEAGEAAADAQAPAIGR